MRERHQGHLSPSLMGDYLLIPNTNQRKNKRRANKSARVPQERDVGMSLSTQSGASLLTMPGIVRQVGKYPFPLQWRVRLMYDTDGLLTSVNGFTASRATVNLSSCYRPDYSGGSSQQPYQWDQLTGIYSQYKVVGVRARVNFWNGSVDGLMVGYRVRSAVDVDTQSQNVRWLEEVPNCRMDIVAIGATKRVSFEGRVDLAKIQSYSQTQFDAVLPIGVSSSPSVPALLDAWVIDLNNNTTRTVDYNISVEYDVQLSGYTAPAES